MNYEILASSDNRHWNLPWTCPALPTLNDEFKIAAEPARAGSLFVGLAADFPALKIDKPDELGAEGFVLKTDGTHVWLIGNKPLGVQHAITTFLHKLGCRWFFPGAVWEVIPRRKTIAVRLDERQVP